MTYSALSTDMLVMAMKLYDGGHPIAIIQIMTVDKNIANLKEVI